jgi:ubiquitin-conjugating enzyme E2 variant
MVPCMQNWQRNNTIETVLVNMRNLMSKPEYRKLAQPPETAVFPS